MEFEQEEFYTYDEKVSCNGVALSAAPAYSDSRGWVDNYLFLIPSLTMFYVFKVSEKYNMGHLYKLKSHGNRL